MNVMNIIAVVCWSVSGAMVLMSSREVTKFDYLCCWIALMMMLAVNIV